MKTRDSILIVLGILFISFNLRAPITAVGSFIDMIKSEFPMSNAMAGFITTLPLIAFAVVSPLVARITHRIGHFKTMMAGLLLIVLGLVVRSYAGMIGLFVGTTVIGIAIAVGNVIVPAIIKSHFAHKVGVVTSIYTTGMCVFAAVGAGVSISLSIAFISLRSPTAEHAAELSGMAQSAGYLFAALGPILTGLLFDELADWTLPLGLFTGLIAFLAFCGMFAGDDRQLEH